ncbi:MAG: SPFH domain-containing protein [Spirochaetia bacterium]
MTEFLNPDTFAMIWGGVGIFVFILILSILKALLKVTLPDKLLVVTGRKRKHNGKSFGFSVERGRTTVIPYLQSVDYLDLGIFPVNVQVEGVNSANGITVGADATACVCIDDDDEGMVYSAVERLMGKDREQIASQIQQTLIGNFRGALNKATPLETIGMTESSLETDVQDASIAIDQGERAQFRNELLEDINSDLSSFGMKVVSVSLQKIWDTSNYIANLAQQTLAEKRKQVEVEEARLRAEAEKAESDAQRRIEIAKSTANEEIVAAREKLEVYRQESEAMIEKASLEAEHAIAEARNKAEERVQSQKVELQKLQNKSEILQKEEAEEKAAEIIASGNEESTRIIEETRNSILKQKVDILKKAGASGRSVLFIQQELPHLYEEYRKYAETMKLNSLLVMDDENGFNKAVNRGPGAFSDFLQHFEKTMGINVRDFVSGKEEA